MISFMKGSMESKEIENLKNLIEANTKDYFPKKGINSLDISTE